MHRLYVLRVYKIDSYFKLSYVQYLINKCMNLTVYNNIYLGLKQIKYMERILVYIFV